MRSFSPVFLLVLTLASCGARTTLVTDQPFREAAPEVVRAWASLSPWRNARRVDLPGTVNVKNLRADVGTVGPHENLLLGVALTPAERQELTGTYTGVNLVYLGPPRPGERTIGVRRAEAWSVLARAAGRPGPATVLFPSNATPDEMQGFGQAWRTSGGGELTTVVGSSGSPLPSKPGQVFFFGNTDAENLIEGVDRTVRVHGNPGFERPPEATGLTWAIKQDGLADFLWDSAQKVDKKAVDLPLETLLERR